MLHSNTVCNALSNCGAGVIAVSIRQQASRALQDCNAIRTADRDDFARNALQCSFIT